MTTIEPFAKPLYVMVKPVGAACNLRCKYCYYLEKSKLYPHENSMMADEMLEHFVREYIGSQTMQNVLFTWHGGEPMLRPVGYYEKVMTLQQKYAGGRNIDNCLQTNGTLVTDEYAEFFRRNGWLIGVSIDGPREYHDAYRRKANGGASFDEVMRGIDILNRHHVEWNAMAVINRFNGSHPVEFYRFFKEIGCRFIQFTPVVDAARLGELTEYSVAPGQWGEFLCGLFDEWVKEDVGEYFVQIFEATLANWCGVAPGICSLSKYCGHAGVLEHTGDLYSCDHFVYPKYKLGNIKEHTILEMMYSERQRQFGRAKFDTLPQQCRQCKWLFTCYGECPKNRLLKTPEGEPGLNYLCEGYRMYFEHVAPFMERMKRNQRPYLSTNI